MKEGNCYVYVYLDPTRRGDHCYENVCFLYEPTYVGKGQGRRYLHHLKSFKNHVNSHFKRRLMRIVQSNYPNIKSYILLFRSELEEREAFDLEMQLIKEIGRSNPGLGPLTNYTNGGEGSSGAVHSEEHKQKNKLASLGRKHSEEVRKQISIGNLGKKRSDATKEKNRQAQLGKKLSEETKRKMHRERSEEVKEKNRQAHLGKKHSEESKKKISAAKLGHKHSEATKNKISERYVSEETREKIRQSKLGKSHSEEHREKNRQAHLGRRQSDETKKKISQTKCRTKLLIKVASDTLKRSGGLR